MENNNLADKISELLSDPEGMSRLEAMAQSLLGEQKGEKEESAPDLSGIDMARVLSAFRSNETDDRSRLLLALRPHLSPSRRDRVDKAVKLLRLVSLMPMLRENGILGEFL
ncbi:MAG: hypothetical protein IKL62_03150 [Clostridia bacterium]|nr:hypothetical protein [Clostridia bacterium]